MIKSALAELHTRRRRRIPRAGLVVDLRADPHERDGAGEHEELQNLVPAHRTPSRAKDGDPAAGTEEALALVMGGYQVDH